VASEQGRGGLRASDADREQAIDVLKAAFVQDRLARAEFEARVGQALASRTYGELAAATDGIPGTLTADTPPGMPARVRKQRTQREMSQGDLAEALGVSRQTVISIESGRYLPSLPLAFAIARFFDVTVDKMFGRMRRRRAHDEVHPRVAEAPAGPIAGMVPAGVKRLVVPNVTDSVSR
jgi:putative transcriptional regulator